MSSASFVSLVDSGVLEVRNRYLESFSVDDLGALFRACSADPAVFAKFMLGIDLYGWQWLVSRRIVSGSKKILLNTSRQIGKSFFVSILALWWCFFNKGKSSSFVHSRVGIISATEGQSKKVMDDIRALCVLGNGFCKEHYSRDGNDVFANGLFDFLLDNSKSATNNKSCITFRPWTKDLGILLDGSLVGSFIKSLPPTQIVRGETFDLLIIDEAAQIDDEIYNYALKKTGEKFNALRIIASTPYGLSGFFYELCDPEGLIPDNPWDRFAFTIDAIQYDSPVEYAQRLKDIAVDISLGKHLVVRQENYCEFVHSEQSFFNPEKVDKMFEDYTPVESFGGVCDLGIDFGGLKKSQTVLTISTISSDGMIKRLYHHAYAVREDGSLIEDIINLFKRFNIQRIIVDECPEGDFMQRKMLDKGWSVTGFKFGSEKVKKYGEFRAVLNRGLVKSYNDSELMGQMKALMTMQGVERTKIQPPPGYSDDYIDSFVISCYHYTTKSSFRTWDIDEVD